MPPAAYTVRQPPTEKAEKPITVLVTGFGPFLARYPRNSSWEIASALPALIPASSESPTPIHIHVHHEAIRVAYHHVADLVPTLLPPDNPLRPCPDIILHIGLAAGRDYFAIEQGARGRGYGKIPDVDGDRFDDAVAERLFPAASYPSQLTTSFDTSDVLARWRANLGGSDFNGGGDATLNGCPDVRISSDAGNFLCGFIYYNSLAHYFSIDQDDRPVVFMHVPDLSSSNDKLKEGGDVTIALIKALVESRRKVGITDRSRRNAARGVGGDAHAGTDNNFA